jgi:hypothetical protein
MDAQPFKWRSDKDGGTKLREKVVWGILLSEDDRKQLHSLRLRQDISKV